ncbi:MAG: sortase [Isosphaeraceae bacterium]|nr:sortase [Isosphaeraceae bacterium]
MTAPGRPSRGVSRPALTLITGAAIVIVAVLLTMALGVGPSGTIPSGATPAPSASAAFGDLPLITCAPAVSPASARAATVSPSASPSSSASAEPGVRANRIKIARLGVDLAIVEGDGLDAPIGKAAHYPGSAWPGGGSNIYIYGHARVGMFLPLWQVRVGDTVELDLVNGTSRTYVVTEILPKVPYDAVTYLEPTPTEQLTLQTSTSYYPTAPRFVVIAVPQA